MFANTDFHNQYKYEAVRTILFPFLNKFSAIVIHLITSWLSLNNCKGPSALASNIFNSYLMKTSDYLKTGYPTVVSWFLSINANCKVKHLVQFFVSYGLNVCTKVENNLSSYFYGHTKIIRRFNWNILYRIKSYFQGYKNIKSNIIQFHF